MNLLNQYGWDHYQSFFSDTNNNNASYSIGRVISIRGMKYHLMTAKGELETELSGNLLHTSSDQQLPKVGDWVGYLDYGDNGYVIAVLPRINELSRKKPGNTSEKQILAANVDYGLIVQGLDRDYNLARLERYLIQLKMGNIAPIVVLNKCDLPHDREQILNDFRSIAEDIQPIFCSASRGDNVQSLLAMLRPEATYLLLGSSGAGKSTLLNALSGKTIQETGEVSDFNAKGRHTTTRRDLYCLASSLIIDSPGMREFGLTEEEGSEALFPRIEALSEACKFRNCSHSGEQGCAVAAALASGALDPDTYHRYEKLRKEMRRFEISAEEKKRKAKQFGRITREAKDHRKKYKY